LCITVFTTAGIPLSLNQYYMNPRYLVVMKALLAPLKHKRFFILTVTCHFFVLTLLAQQPEDELPAQLEGLLEQEATVTDMVTDDDSQLQRLSSYSRRKLPLNTADEAALQSLGLLHPLQINSLLNYRKLMGNLVSIYELQAVPGFDPALIQLILPYVTVGNDLEPHYTLRDYLSKGEHAVLLRYGRQLERAKGYLSKDGAMPHYLGSPDKLLLRYRYSFPRYASWGVTMKKDAGEQFFNGAQRAGFDFYSAHLFIRNYKHIKALAIGDFTVNMGQGLVNWQSLAYGRSVAVMQVKREGDILRPYSAAGEFYFFRGVGITLAQKRWEVTGFISQRQLDGNILPPDGEWENGHLSSIINTGYHRAENELAHQHAVTQLTGGGSIQYKIGRWQVGTNAIYHRLSLPLQKKPTTYNQYEFSGQESGSASIDYSGYWKNVHFFGEAAMSNNGKIATVHGVLTSVSKRIDVALLYRNYHPAYQSLYSNAFGDSNRGANEHGVYTAVTVSITPKLKVNVYADIFRFPWWKYQVDGPSGGNEQLVLLSYTPSKKISAMVRYRYAVGEKNLTVDDEKGVLPVVKRNIRGQLNMQLHQRITVQSRLEHNVYLTANGRQQGWLVYQQVQYRLKPLPVNVACRITAFNTSNYDSRIYAVESGVLYDYSVAQFYGSGWQYNTTLKWRVSKGLYCWLHCRQVFYDHVSSIGSGWDQVNGAKKTTVQLQLQQLF
jgi:hypothetical protein